MAEALALVTALTTALAPLLASLQVLTAQGEAAKERDVARETRETARDARETARDARETARDARESARDVREEARFGAIMAQGNALLAQSRAHAALLDRVASAQGALVEGSSHRSPFSHVSKAEVGGRALALLAAAGADESAVPDAGPAALQPALLACLRSASTEGELVALVLPHLRRLLGCGGGGRAPRDACARLLVDGQDHPWLDHLAPAPLPSSRREKPDLFLLPEPCLQGVLRSGGAAEGALASRALQLEGCVREVLEAKRGAGCLSSEDFGQLVSYLDRLPGPTRGALFNARELWLYEALDGAPVRLTRTLWGAGGSAALLRGFFPPRWAEAPFVSVLRGVMAELGVVCAEAGAAFLGAGATGRVFCVQSAAAAAPLQAPLALKVSSRVPQGELELEFGTLAAAAARGAPVAVPVPGSCTKVFSAGSGAYLGGGYLLSEVMSPTPPIKSLLRCRQVFRALSALHAGGFPHGDARLPNLLQRSDGVLVWIDVRTPQRGAAAFAADRELLAASVLSTKQRRKSGLVAAALEAAAEARGAAAFEYDALAAAVYEVLE
jgi:hypothetical protein